MLADHEAVMHTKDEELLPCPMCAGRVSIIESSWNWGPYDLRHVKFRCSECNAIFEYAWRTDPYKHVPHAVEWWNTRTPDAPPWTCCGYDTQELAAVADLMKEHDIGPERLGQLLANLEAAKWLAEKKFTTDLIRQLQEKLDTDNGGFK